VRLGASAKRPVVEHHDDDGRRRGRDAVDVERRVNALPTNLINQVLGDFRGDTLNSVSSALGESPAKMQSALGAAGPAVVGGLANRVSNAGDANNLLEMIRGNHFDSGEYSDPAAAVKGSRGLSGLIDAGRPLLDSVFGSKTGSVADWVSSSG